MKILAILTVMFSLSAQAADTYNCWDKADRSLSYSLESLDFDHYSFTVTRRILIPRTCGSRWGCEYEEQVITTDKLRMTDYQGAAVFKSKRTSILMEDMNEVSYRYTFKGTTRSGKLGCQLI